MIKHLKFVPNFLTSANLISGCLSIVFSFEGRLDIALYLVLLAAVFDFLDGFAARVLEAISPIGKELDSLSDLISFGLAPAVMIYVVSIDVWSQGIAPVIKYLPFLLVVFSALRLAKFNVDTRQDSDFLGLPTPANALFFISFANLIQNYSLFQNETIIATTILFFSIMMVSELKIFSLKKIADDKVKLSFVILLVLVAVVSIGFYGLYAGVIIIPVYLLLSGIKTFIIK